MEDDAAAYASKDGIHTEVECAACGRAWDDSWTRRDELEAEPSVEGPEMSKPASICAEPDPWNGIAFGDVARMSFLLFVC